jgi:hypothetical protein
VHAFSGWTNGTCDDDPLDAKQASDGAVLLAAGGSNFSFSLRGQLPAILKLGWRHRPPSVSDAFRLLDA